MHFVTYSNWYHEDERGFCWCNRMRRMVNVTMLHASLGVILHFTVRKWDISCNFLVCLWCSVAVLFQFRRFYVLYLHASACRLHGYFSVCFSFFSLFFIFLFVHVWCCDGTANERWTLVAIFCCCFKFLFTSKIPCIIPCYMHIVYIQKRLYANELAWRKKKRTKYQNGHSLVFGKLRMNATAECHAVYYY